MVSEVDCRETVWKGLAAPRPRDFLFYLTSPTGVPRRASRTGLRRVLGLGNKGHQSITSLRDICTFSKDNTR